MAIQSVKRMLAEMRGQYDDVRAGHQVKVLQNRHGHFLPMCSCGWQARETSALAREALAAGIHHVWKITQELPAPGNDAVNGGVSVPRIATPEMQDHSTG